MNTKKSIFLVFRLMIMILVLSLIFARKSAVEAENGATPTAKVTILNDDQKEEIESLREEVKKKVEEKLKTITDEKSEVGKRRSWIGIIKEKTAAGLTLLVRGETKQVKFDEGIKIVNSARKDIKIDDLKPGIKVIAMGYVQEDESLLAKRIVVAGNLEPRKTKVVFGKITDKSKSGQILVIADANEEGKDYETIIDDKTKILQVVAGKIKKAKYDDFKIGQSVVVVLTPVKGQENRFTAKNILILTED